MVGDRKKDLYTKVLKLRRAGYSYGKISKTLGISKSTLCDWLSGKVWSDLITTRLAQENRKQSYDLLIKFNRQKHLDTLVKYDNYRIEAAKDFERLKSDNLFLVCIAIYWGEGDKTNQGKVAVINSDVNLLKLIINFYRQTLKISEDRLRAALFLYEDINELEAKEYWSKNLNLDKKQFIKTQILPSRSYKIHKKVRYGMCNIYFSSVEMNIKMKEWIKILPDNLRV